MLLVDFLLSAVWRDTLLNAGIVPNSDSAL